MPSVSGMTTMTAPRPAAAGSPLARLVRHLGIDSVYLLTGFPLALVSFVVLVTGLSVGGGLLVMLVGIPVLTATLYIARGFAQVERWRAAKVLDAPHIPGAYRRPGPDAGTWRRMFAPMADPQSWLDVLHGMIMFPIATVTWSLMVTWWSGAIAGVFYGLYDWALPHSPDDYELTDILGMGNTPVARITLNTAIGIFFLFTLPILSRLCVLVQAGLSKAMLSGVTELRGRISGLEQATATAQSQTAAAVSAEATALRRLERDIHDGPQQRLVRLAMDLGRAQHQLDTDPVAARTTVAVAALAGRCTVPVDLEAPELGRLDPSVESTAYFVLAEALTNVAKHSHASDCQVTIRRDPDSDGDHLVVIVVDDGVGGAALAKGHGLAGLNDRVHAAGGDLILSSPPGGPTTVCARLPCR